MSGGGGAKDRDEYLRLALQMKGDCVCSSRKAAVVMYTNIPCAKNTSTTVPGQVSCCGKKSKRLQMLGGGSWASHIGADHFAVYSAFCFDFSVSLSDRG